MVIWKVHAAEPSIAALQPPPVSFRQTRSVGKKWGLSEIFRHRSRSLLMARQSLLAKDTPLGLV